MIEVAGTTLTADLLCLPERGNLVGWVRRYVGRLIPYKAICPNHDAPASFLDNILYEPGDCCTIACRGGGKTDQEGIAAGMVARLKQGDVRVLGGSARQTQACYAAFNDFLKAGFYQDVDGDVLLSRTKFRLGGKVELLAQSTTSVRSPHVPWLFLDEVDEFVAEVLRAAKFIPQSDPVKGHRQKMVMASTRHVPMGLMTEEWDNFVGRKLIWCLWEILQPCGGDYSCSRCNLAATCPGKKKMGPQAKQMSGYYTVDDARALRARTHDDEAWNSEALCREPRAEGAVYKLDERVHMDDVPYDPQLPVDRWFDYGSADDPCICGWWQVTNTKGRRQARCIGTRRWRGKSDAYVRTTMLEEEKKRGYGWMDKTYMPGDAASLKNEFEEHGIIVETADMTVMDGINHVRNLLAVDEKGTPGIVFDRSCNVRQEGCFSDWEEMKGYRLERGRPVKQNDHFVDLVRYGCMTEPTLKMRASASAFGTTSRDVDP